MTQKFLTSDPPGRRNRADLLLTSLNRRKSFFAPTVYIVDGTKFFFHDIWLVLKGSKPTTKKILKIFKIVDFRGKKRRFRSHLCSYVVNVPTVGFLILGAKMRDFELNFHSKQ